MTTKGRRKAPRFLTGLKLRLPGWTSGVSPFGALYPRDEDKVEFAVRLSRWNVRHGTGGPFGAAVFEDPSGRLISLGVNAVLENRCSLAHAEMLSLALAQRKLRRHRLNGRPGKSYVLASSAQPCAMCFGAVLWAGLDALVFAATKTDVERLTGFKEGSLPGDWQRELERRGIRLRAGLGRREACRVLSEYKKKGGVLY